MTAQLASPRIVYRRLAENALEPFHRLATDEHVRRYLLDGEVVDRDWCRERLAASEQLFAEHGVGLWLASLSGRRETPIGFGGYFRFPELSPQPQLLYALTGEHAGQGLATEMAQALIEFVRRHTAWREITAAVDEPNAASSRVLTKLSFEEVGSSPGVFGRTLHYQLSIHRDE